MVLVHTNPDIFETAPNSFLKTNKPSVHTELKLFDRSWISSVGRALDCEWKVAGSIPGAGLILRVLI